MGANHSSDSGAEDMCTRRQKRISSVPAKKSRGSASSNDSSSKENKSSISSKCRRGSSSARGSSEDVSPQQENLGSARILSMSASSTSLNKVHSAGNVLSKRQRLLIENSWKRSRKTGADNVGSRIFLLVLTAQPDIKMIFGLQKIPQGRLKYDPRFRQHAVVFTKTFDYIIKNLEFTEKLAQHFQSLGKKHVTMQGRGFLPQYWDTFAECMTQTAIEWEGGRRCRETMNAWRVLVGFIIKQMRLGFDLENNTRKRFSSLQPTPRKSLVPAEPPKQKPPPGPPVPQPTSVRSTEVRPQNLNGWHGYYLHPHNSESQLLYRPPADVFHRQDSSRSTSGYASDYGSDLSTEHRQSPRRRPSGDVASPRQLPPRPDHPQFGCPCPRMEHPRERSQSPPYLDALESFHIDSPHSRKKISLPGGPPMAFPLAAPQTAPYRKYSTGVMYYQ